MCALLEAYGKPLKKRSAKFENLHILTQKLSTLGVDWAKCIHSRREFVVNSTLGINEQEKLTTAKIAESLGISVQNVNFIRSQTATRLTLIRTERLVHLRKKRFDFFFISIVWVPYLLSLKLLADEVQ